MNDGLLNLGTDDLARESYIRNVELGKVYALIKSKILSSYSDSILDINIDSCRSQYEDIQEKWFLPRYFAKRKYFKNLRQYGSITEENLEDVFADVKDCQTKRKDLDKMSSAMSEVFGILALRDEEQWDKIGEHLEAIPELTRLILEYTQEHELKYKEGLDAFVNSSDGQWNVYKKDFTLVATSTIDEYNHIVELKGKLLELTEAELSLEEIKNELDNWINHYASIKDWYHWIVKKRELTVSNLKTVSDKIENDDLTPVQAIN